MWLTDAVTVWAQSALKRLKAAPEPYLELAADLIHGFGGAQGIDRAGIARFVALERAEARAGALRRIYLADLDFDITVSREEIAQVAAAASAAMRGAVVETARGGGCGWRGGGGFGDLAGKADSVAAGGRHEPERLRLGSDCGQDWL